jgi:L-histidine N-alpha-methyltransferase
MRRRARSASSLDVQETLADSDVAADSASEAAAVAPDAQPSPEECAHLRACLSRAVPEIPARYFYDDHGSALFEAITELPVYYQTRTEIAILEHHAAEILERVRPRHLVELGSGAGRKIRLLLDAWLAPSARSGPRAERGRSCTMLDINAAFLQQSVDRLRADYPGCGFRGVVGDFTTDLHRLGPGTDRLIVFFAGTIGNLDPGERLRFLGALADMMAPGDGLLLGVDLVKDHAVLEAAYNDPQGVTAAFNRNVLAVVNRRFRADFEPDAFVHRAFYDPDNARIEMRLRALRPMRVHLRAPGFEAGPETGIDTDFTLDLADGAEIRTEISCKFTRASLSAIAREAKLGLTGWFTDPEQRFALALLTRSAAPNPPRSEQ